MPRAVLTICAATLFVFAWEGRAEAKQASGTFSVGITIGGGRGPVRPSPPQALKYTWSAAAISVRRAGFKAVARLAAGQNVYWFSAQREGRRYRIAVSVATGRIVTITAA